MSSAAHKHLICPASVGFSTREIKVANYDSITSSENEDYANTPKDMTKIGVVLDIYTAQQWIHYSEKNDTKKEKKKST
ncbi:hypothetical protein [Klebsiella pneumoniae]|uniref:hypothetical protein n=1 Tax=Klebsiella pneumoniae TaxID=573 RepID=UPI001CEDC767|nr:hypothetical protein [Klebsiella pneumoniae]